MVPLGMYTGVQLKAEETAESEPETAESEPEGAYHPPYDHQPSMHDLDA